MVENFDVMYWIVIPMLICVTRIIDVSLGTLRIVFISRGHKFIAPVIGFVEITIWLIAISRIMQNMDNVVYFIAYAAGFSLGNFVGLVIEEKLAMGYMSVRIITSKPAEILIQSLKEKGLRLTTVNGMGLEGPVKIIYAIINRKKLTMVVKQIKAYNPLAFYALEDVKSISLDLSQDFPSVPKKHQMLLLRRRKKEKM